MAFDPNDPDTKAAIAAAVAEAKTGLETKRDELLAEVKELKQRVRASSEIKPEDLAKAEERAEQAEAALAEAQKQVKAITGERDKLAKTLEAESGFTSKLLVENGLRDALVANGVTNAVHQKAAMAMLAGGVQIAAEGETRVAKFGDKALGDFVKEWASSEEGKHFVAAPMNGGGGAGGGGQPQGGGKTVTREAWNGMSHVERSAFAKDGGKVVDQAA